MTNKDLISQYVDTGLKLPEYQVNKLSNQDKKTYLRKRLISYKNHGSEIDDNEFNNFSEKEKMEFAEIEINKNLVIPYKRFKLFTPENKLIIAIKYAKKGIRIKDEQFESLLPKDREELVDVYSKYSIRISGDIFELLSPDARIKYIFNMVDNPDGISYLLDMVPKEIAKKYVLIRFKKGRKFSDYELGLLPIKLKREYIFKYFDVNPMIIFKYLEFFSPEERLQFAIKLIDKKILNTMDLEMLLPKDRIKYVIKLAEKAYNLEKNQFDLLPSKNKMEYIDKMSNSYRPMINTDIFNSLPIDIKKQYILNRYENGGNISSDFVEYLPPEVRNKQK